MISSTQLTTVPERAADWRWRIGVGVLLLASGTAVVMMKVDGPVIFAGLVFRRWHLVGVLFGAGIGFLFASWGLRLRPEWDRPQRSPGRRFAVGAFGAGAVVVAGFLFFFTEHLDAAIGYTVLSPAGDDGCRLVVSENLSQEPPVRTNRVQVLPAGVHRSRPVDLYRDETGYPTFSGEVHDLVWSGDVAELIVWTYTYETVSYTLDPFACD